jgi:hypothetical protein
MKYSSPSIRQIAAIFLSMIPSGSLLFGVAELKITHSTIEENAELLTKIGDITVSEGALSDYNLSLEPELADNTEFRLYGGTLYSYRSFDYEWQRERAVTVTAVPLGGGDPIVGTFTITVENISGKFDTDGIADAEVAEKYAQVQAGDYLVLNGRRGQLSVNPPTSITYPQKIFVRGGSYSAIQMRLDNVHGNSPAERVVISNFLGQVKSKSISATNGSYWRLTGRYDPNLGTGSRFFRGCDTNDSTIEFYGSHGSYGFWIQNHWENESSILLYVNGTATGYEVDHIESGDGGFAGAMFKQDNGSVNMDDVYLHHLYIHDVGSEGIYLGSTQGNDQHQFNNLLIENCVFLRTGGEAIQVGQLEEGCVIRNNVAWGGFDWLSPFSRYQDKALQVGTRQGGNTVEDNIFMGGGESFFLATNDGLPDITPNGDPIRFANNLFWGDRGWIGGYQSSGTDGVTPWEWDGNYWGYFDFDYDRAFELSNRGYIVGVATNTVDITFSNNHYDSTGALFVRQGSASISDLNNHRGPIDPPSFVNLIGEDPGYPYLKWTRWTPTIGADTAYNSGDFKKGDPVVFEPGDVVQFTGYGDTRFYRCLEQHSARQPSPEGDSTWELLTWIIGDSRSLLPPDDVRLVPDSTYEKLGMGPFEEPPINVDPIVVNPTPRWSDYPWFNEQGDVNTGNFLGWISVRPGDWLWSYSFSNWLYMPEPETDKAGAWGYLPRAQ